MTLKSLGELYPKIQDILLHEWDPIGVSGIKEARDEYDGYIPVIYDLLISNVRQDDVEKYLSWLETEHMGLNGDGKNTEKVANHLKNLLV